MKINSLNKWKRHIAHANKRSKKRENKYIRKKGNGSKLDQLARRNSFYRFKLRQRATKAEIEFGKILCKLKITFRFQKGFFYPYHIIVDFYIAGKKIAFEVDGKYHLSQLKKDKERDSALFSRGVTTHRFTNDDVLNKSKKVCLKIKSILK